MTNREARGIVAVLSSPPMRNNRQRGSGFSSLARARPRSRSKSTSSKPCQCTTYSSTVLLNFEGVGNTNPVGNYYGGQVVGGPDHGIVFGATPTWSGPAGTRSPTGPAPAPLC